MSSLHICHSGLYTNKLSLTKPHINEGQKCGEDWNKPQTRGKNALYCSNWEDIQSVVSGLKLCTNSPRDPGVQFEMTQTPYFVLSLYNLQFTMHNIASTIYRGAALIKCRFPNFMLCMCILNNNGILYTNIWHGLQPPEVEDAGKII